MEKAYWKWVPRNQFICVLTGLAGQPVLAMKWWCLCPEHSHGWLFAELHTDRERKGIMFLPAWSLLLHTLWPFPLPLSDLSLVVVFFFSFLSWVLPMPQNIPSLIPYLNTKFSWVCLLSPFASLFQYMETEYRSIWHTKSWVRFLNLFPQVRWISGIPTWVF